MKTQKTIFAITAELDIIETTIEKTLTSKKVIVNVCDTYKEADKWVGYQYLINA